MLMVGNWVEVRSKEEILSTLDEDGKLEGMPFMPEMFAFAGKRFQVYKSAHKTCDTVFPVRGRRVHRAVHLETRCNGEAHGDCQAGCLIFWKEAWLKPVNAQGSTSRSTGQCTERDVFDRAKATAPNGTATYMCQATQLPYATADLEWWDVRQYIVDFWSGNVGLWRMFCGLVYSVYFSLQRAGIGVGRPMRWFYDRFYPLWRGTPFPRKTGSIPQGEPTPVEILNLQPGELVRIKTHDEILKTLNTGSRNRGLYWDAEEVPYCGGTYKVLRRLERIVNEKTGKMLEMKTPCIVLDTVICQSRYSDCRMFCPRSIYSYWREIWLERVGKAPAGIPVESDREVVTKP
jgi:hypothetical protein